MFRDKYRADNEKIYPDQALLKYLSVKMKSAGPAPAGARKPRFGKSRIIRSAAAVAACLALAISAGGLYVFFDADRKQPPVATNGSGENSKTEVKNNVSYAELYALIKSMEPADAADDAEYGEEQAAVGGSTQAAANPSMKGETAPTSGKAEATDGYSKTNTQVQGVDEADIVKTDGNYIYTLANGNLKIVSAKGADMKTVSSTDLTKTGSDKKMKQPIEFYVNGNRLVVIENIYDYSSTDAVLTDGGRKAAKDSVWYNNGPTNAAVYDISDRSKPKLLKSLGQSGNYLSSRMVGRTLYLITNHQVYRSIVEDSLETYIPSLYVDGSPKIISAADITISEQPQDRQYVVVTAVDINAPDQQLSSKTVFGCGTTLYANTENILIASYAKSQAQSDTSAQTSPAGTAARDGSGSIEPYGAAVTEIAAEKAAVEPEAAANPERTAVTGKTGGASPAGNNESTTTVSYNVTNLLRFSLNNGKIAFAASGKVKGGLLNQFSIDEYKGVFRIVTTTYSYTETRSGTGNEGIVSYTPGENTNALYTLNQKLEVIGRIEDVAKGERVYSVRFSGDTGYFVTYRQVDPLFAVDLSNPAKPKILSALKIPGFSNYLHPYSGDLLFGFGQNADLNGKVQGLKLSMFDISDPADVSEKHKLILSQYYYSEASYNHKAIIVSPERGIIAFPCDNKYLVFSYSKNAGFVKKGEFAVSGDGYNQRGLYIGNVFYVCTNLSITAYSMGNYAKLAVLKF